MGHRKKYGVLAALLLVTLSLTGCLFDSPVEELYSLPQLPVEYTELESRIDAILASGAEYAAPVSGTNIQPVQLVDLDGDGTEEAVAFFRKTSDEKPLKIYIFRAQDEAYEQAAVIEGSGTTLYSVAYNDMDMDGKTELIVGWKISSELKALQALSVYALPDLQPEELMRSAYVKYAMADLNRDNRQELVVIRADGEGSSMADYYDWREQELTLTSSARVSMSVAELSRVKSGKLQNDIPALFVTGVEESSIGITDVLAVRDGALVNVTLSGATGVSTEIFRFLSLYPQDINGDGLTEVPVPSLLPEGGDETVRYQINWRNYDLNGTPRVAQVTYHDVEDGWYLTLPEEWDGRILVTRGETGAEENCVTFFIRGEGKEPARTFLKIYTITGDSREYKAVRGTRFVLSRQTETIFAAELLPAGAAWRYRLTEEELLDSFHLILNEWTAGDS
ncbi:MAG: VCBS repeat-containing protein [Oscillospiraceae bacterium]